MKYYKNGYTYPIILFFTLLFISGCESSDTNPEEIYCKSQNGIVITSPSTGEKLCKYTKTYDYDDGNETYTFSCNITNFYEDGECKDLESESYTPPLTISFNPTIGETFHRATVDILSKLNNTGYTHKTHGPFVLHPNPQELIHTNELNQIKFNSEIESYNLFLDCSGFVGYYIVQGISKQLYQKVNTCYHTSRPLAADFADTFEAAEHNVTNTDITDALLSDLNNTTKIVEWGRVAHIKDAKAGDIIVYKHSQNIINHGECNNTIIKHRNTGHVLFIMSTPHRSTHYPNEWLVKVADSTTAPHSHDSRRISKCDQKIWEQSYYKNSDEVQSNHYTAWSKRYGSDYMELCKTDDNNTFHRRCSDFGLNRELKIELQTDNIGSPTGIGSGNIYISSDMKHYRVKEYADKKRADIFIGRPIAYDKIIMFKNKEYKLVVSPETNRTWLDRNLGAAQACNSFYDNQCVGDFYQWGREADGHQEFNSSLQAEQATSLTNVGDKYITYRTDWTTLDKNGSLRSDFWSNDQNGTVCPIGFRVPTISELLDEFQKIVDDKYVDVSTPQENFLHLSIAGGYRDFSKGAFKDKNESGTLWSSTSDGDRRPASLDYNDCCAGQSSGRPTYGYNIRCIQESKESRSNKIQN